MSDPLPVFRLWSRRLPAIAVLLSACLAASAQTDAPDHRPQTGVPVPGETARHAAARLTKRGGAYLLTAQDADGAWAPKAGPGITCLVLKALINELTIGPEHPAVKRGIDWVLGFQHDDGGFYSPEGLIKNYETSVAVSMLSAMPGDQYKDRIAKARKFLIDLQWDEGEGKSVDDPQYGGAGYGRGKRPDLSNTQMMVEALHDSGLPADDPAYKKALVFIARCQMLGETNDQSFAKGSTEGGFIYTDTPWGQSKAGTENVDGDRELRCYGSMTYAGFKSMLYAGLTKDDPRVKAALDWIGRNWTLEYNPNMPERQAKQGLYYYYHVFGRAMQAYGQAQVSDAHGRQHDWRRELITKLASVQRPDGSWVNTEDRWMEGIPALTTAYAMLALEATWNQTD